ncbi:MAG: hypothetical protein ACRBEE_07510 [Arenicella sp.]
MLLLMPLIACSNKQVYDAVQANQRSQCKKLPNSEYEECKQREQLSYEQYQEERQKLKKY